MWIVFIGPPGAGKGTQCTRLAQTLGVPHLSTGELLRSTFHQRSALADQIGGFINVGQLAPDYLVMRIVRARLAQPDCRDGCIFDGFPRTLPQAQLLDEYLEGKGQSLDLVLNLQVDQDELVQRMLRRAEIERRADDTAETIAQRFRVFHTQTAPLLDFYQRRGIVQTVDGMQSPDAVTCDIRGRLAARARATSG